MYNITSPKRASNEFISFIKSRETKQHASHTIMPNTCGLPCIKFFIDDANVNKFFHW